MSDYDVVMSLAEMANADLLAAVERVAYRLEQDGRTADGISKADAAIALRAAIARATGA